MRLISQSEISMLKSVFTLIELLVVIAIISILTSILLPALNKARTTTKSIKCLGNTKQMAVAFNNYQDDNDGWSFMVYEDDGGVYLTKSLWYGKLTEYLGGKPGSHPAITYEKTYYCPEDPVISEGEGIIYANISYGLSGLFVTGGSLGKTTKVNAVTQEPGKQIVIGDSDSTFRPYINKAFVYRAGWRHRRRANFCFLDGHSESLRLTRETLGNVKHWISPELWSLYSPSYSAPPSESDWTDYLITFGTGN